MISTGWVEHAGFIDHATGVVIGEQASVGDDCYILHGVTLGATGKKDKKTGRRHPVVGSKCTIGSGASVLGPNTGGHVVLGVRPHVLQVEVEECPELVRGTEL